MLYNLLELKSNLLPLLSTKLTYLDIWLATVLVKDVPVVNLKPVSLLGKPLDR